MSKKLLRTGFFATLFSFCGLMLHGQVDVTATGGTLNASYTTLNGAFTAVNSGLHQGVITIAITGNTTEPAAVALAASGQGSASYTSIVIKPTVPAVISGAPVAGHGIIELNGADNVTIDGSVTTGGTTRDLTFQNTAAITQANVTAIRLIGANSGGLGATNIVIKNCIIAGNTPGNSGSSGSTVTTAYGIYAGSTSTTTLSASGTGYNYDNVTIENNHIKSAYYGIYIAGGASPNQNDNLIIRGNTIGSSNPLEQISIRGIDASQLVNALITGNEIFDQKVSTSISISAIEVGGTASTNAEVSRNNIHGIYSESASGYGAAGITVSAGTAALVVNNVIYDIRTVNESGTSTVTQAFGIRLAGGTGHKIYYNSVHLYGDYSTGPSTTYARSAALIVTTTSVTGLEIKNNIFSNKMTSSTASTPEFLAVWFPASYNFFNATLDNNAYMVTDDAAHYVGKTGTTGGSGNYATLSDWKAISQVNNATNDVNSIPTGVNGNAPFTADNDLTIPAGTSTPIESGGVVIVSLGVPNTDFLAVNRPAGAGTAPDMGAYEFAGMPVTADVGIEQLTRPLLSGCHTASDSVVIRIRNYISDPINFVSDPLTLTAYTTGANPVSFTPVVINTGTLAGNATMDVVVSSAYDMSIQGTHNFHAYVDVAADNVSTNDTMAVTSIVISGGTATAASGSVCLGYTATLSLSGQMSGATFQWQQSANGTTWTNVTGGTVSPFNVGPTDTTYYRALVCGIYSSVIDTVNVIDFQPPVATGATRCGPGTATLTATGNGTLNWFNASSGGSPLGTGASFVTPLVDSTTTFYVSAGSGSSTNVGMASSPGGTSGAGQNTYGLYFDAFSSFTLIDVTVYPVSSTPGTPGSVTIAVIDAAGTILHQATVNVTGYPTSSLVGQVVSLNFPIAPGTGYRLVPMNRTGISGLIFQPSSGGPYPFPYTVPGVVSITSGTYTSQVFNDLYYYFYNWTISTGCESTRVPVTVNVTPSDSVHITAASNPLCLNSTSALTVSSGNANYQYTWSPAAGLNTTTGASVTIGTDSSIVYTVNAFDAGTNCAAYSTIAINVVDIPQINATPSDTTVCMNQPVQLLSDASGSSNTVVIGTGTSTNTATTTGVNGPYGGYYGGTRNQYLFLASELQAEGLTAGLIDYLEFDVAALNGVGGLQDYTIRMDTTSLTALASFVTGLPTVSSDTLYMPVTGWNHHPVAAFNWDGVSNIIIEICYNNEDAGFASGNASVRYTATGFNSVLYYHLDNSTTVCTNTSSTASTSRPNIRFGRNAPLGYTWNPIPGLNNSSINNPVLIAGATGDYVVTVTDQYTNCQNKDTISITVNLLPAADIGNDTTLCNNTTGGGFFLDATGPGISYLWQDSTTAPTYLVNMPGTYHVTVTDANGCRNSDTVVVVGVFPLQADIDIDVTSTNTATLDAGAGFVSYLWSNFTTGQSLNITGNGTYWVMTTDMNGCTSSDTVNMIFSLDVLNPDGSEVELTYYPNPSQGIVNFSLQGLKADRMQLDIMDMSGKKVFARSYENISASMADQLDLTYLSGGTYIVRLTTENGTYMNRIVITKP